MRKSFPGWNRIPLEHLKIFNEGGRHDELVLVKDIPLYSVCEHHLLPFIGRAHIAYIPKNGRIIGLSKFARIVDCFARRPQVQERLTGQIADFLYENLDPLGVAVFIQAEHLCMTMRGARAAGSMTQTSALRGCMRSDAKTRAEVMSLLGGQVMGGPVFRAGAFAIPLTRTYVMGILNVTPDSFSDGGKYQSVQAAVSRAVEMAREGADIIDIGGQSTRPGYQAVSQEEEWARIQEVIPAVVRAAGLPVSVDTFYPWVAQRALAAGASILNDVTGFGEEMLQVAAGSDCGCVVMDPGSTGENICARVRSFFLDRLEAAKAAGVSRERLCFDPGVGFGKTLEENLTLLAHVERTRVEGCAFLMAASRKRVTGAFCGNPPFEQRLPATLAAHTAAILGGADLVRVHDVKEAVQAAKMADALKNA